MLFPPVHLVMRAEGVLRLILNVALFAGMTLELTDKYVKTVVMEEGKMSPIAIKVGLPPFFLLQAKAQYADRDDTDTTYLKPPNHPGIPP